MQSDLYLCCVQVAAVIAMPFYFITDFLGHVARDFQLHNPEPHERWERMRIPARSILVTILLAFIVFYPSGTVQRGRLLVERKEEYPTALAEDHAEFS